MFFKKKYEKLPKIEFSGVLLGSPLGVYEGASASKNYRIHTPVPGFLTLTPPKDGILGWVSQLQAIRKETVLAVNLRSNIQRTFALLYDFVDFLVIDTGSDKGTAEVSDIKAMMDDLLSLRLCYEHYTRILVRITPGLSEEEILPLLEYCRLAGIDGVIASGEKKFRIIKQQTQNRFPCIVSTSSPQEAVSLCCEGIPVETDLGALQRIKILRTITENSIKCSQQASAQ